MNPTALQRTPISLAGLAGLLLLTACRATASAVIPKDPLLLVSTRGDERVTSLSLEDLQAEWSVELGLGAHELAVSPDGRLAAGSAYGGPGAGHQPADNRLAVFDLESHELVSTIDLGEHERPNDLAFLPDARHLLVTSEVRGALLLVDSQAGEVAEVFDLEEQTGHMLAYAKEAPGELGRVFVSHVASGQVSAVDVKTGEILAKLPAAHGAEGIATTDDGSRVWCANNRSHSITILDGQALEVVDTFECQGFPFRVKASGDGGSMVVSCPMSQEVLVFDVGTAELLQTFDLSGRGQNVSPQGVAISSDGRRVAVACPGTGEVLLLEVETGEVLAAFKAGPMLDPIVLF